MKEAIISKGPLVHIVDSPIPTLQPDQVLIKVVVSGTNPKDWKLPEWTGKSGNQGDDIAGTVAAVGENVTEFKPGDRVAAFHQTNQPGAAYAEYAVSWQHTTFHIPKSTTFEEAATIPLTAMTSVVALYHHLGLPHTWEPATSRIPLIIYGGATAIGSFAIKLARKSNIHPIITVAGRGIAYVENLLDSSKGDAVIDYRQGDEAVVSGIHNALKLSGNGDATVLHAYDAVSDGSSFLNLGKVVSPGGKIVLVLPGRDLSSLPDSIETVRSSVGIVHGDHQDLGYIYYRLLSRGLLEGWFTPHPHEVVPGGLDGLQTALTNLKEGKASALKYVVRIGETEGVEDC
ncbi:hypothetical protein P175DRAFT_0559903 [Aspergillus ochraceoroseus IBT 24754]|uniref:Enoyl reductase (ER) domain-containing protein n=1 Tax=Aspergillus ochraceoroseus IBT 24754 TaxID=1392256 RepID=A0A2T5LNY2_9EURO|nr:uncharacterized protein P175DRAFT_0559903 [Aspergillus ochraceoroseus IBT 24754]PTU17993.1 hypothetical protein P175DRAFT_0559903 [Aspergillus ochraceoroseus IBT 24754]